MSNIPKLPDSDEELDRQLNPHLSNEEKDEPLEPGKIYASDLPDIPTIKHPDIFEDVLESMTAKYPQVVGTTPQWPRFDIMKTAYEGVNHGFGKLGDSIQRTDLPETAVNLVSMLSLTMGLAIALGIDVRPLWVAAHKARMTETEANIALLLDLQDPLKQAE